MTSGRLQTPTFDAAKGDGRAKIGLEHDFLACDLDRRPGITPRHRLTA